MRSSEQALDNAPNRSWNLKILLLCHLLAAILLTTLFLPLTQGAWEAIDTAFFKWINGSLRDRPLWQLFWAMANHKLADWVEDLCVLCFFITYVRQATKGLRLRRVSELLFWVIYIGAIIYFVNRLFFAKHWNIPRLSPTLVVEDCVRLSREIPWMSIKDGSAKSFPGDHGTTALLFASSFTCLAGWRLGILASLYAAFLCLPRLFTGAHWLSDVIVGSGSIAIVFTAWAFYSPLFQKVTDWIENFFRAIVWLKNKAISSYTRST